MDTIGKQQSQNRQLQNKIRSNMKQNNRTPTVLQVSYNLVS